MTPEEERFLRSLAAKMDAVKYNHQDLQKACQRGTPAQVRTHGRRLIANVHRLLRAWPKR